MFVSEIARLLPKAKIIHLIRDPREVVASLLAASKDWGRNWAPRRASKAVAIWWQHVSAAERAATRLSHEQFFGIHYQDLYADPVSKLGEISKFLKIEWPESARSLAVKINSAENLRQGKGTPILIKGEHRKNGQETVFEPREFIRKAQAGSWRKDLNWLKRLQVYRALRKIGPQWKQYANK